MLVKPVSCITVHITLPLLSCIEKLPLSELTSLNRDTDPLSLRSSLNGPKISRLSISISLYTVSLTPLAINAEWTKLDKLANCFSMFIIRTLKLKQIERWTLNYNSDVCSNKNTNVESLNDSINFYYTGKKKFFSFTRRTVTRKRSRTRTQIEMKKWTVEKYV